MYITCTQHCFIDKSTFTRERVNWQKMMQRLRVRKNER